MKERMLIGELLVRGKVIRKEHVEDALEVQKKTKKKLGEILITMGHIDSQILTKKLGDQAGIPFMKLKAEKLDKNLIKSFPFWFLHAYNILPLYERGEKIYVATGDPANPEILSRLGRFTRKAIVLVCAEPMQIIKLLVEECY